MSRLTLFVLFAFALLTFVCCEELLINSGTLPVDTVIYTAGDKAINVVIPNSKATNSFTIAFDSSRRWVNNNVGMRDYTYNITLLSKPFYSAGVAKEDYIENFGTFGRFKYRAKNNFCMGAPFTNMKNLLSQPSVNCTAYLFIVHIGLGIYSFKEITDDYYPMVFRIEPIFNNYTKVVVNECNNGYINCNYCPCITSKGIEFDESYFYTTKRVSSNMVSSSTYRFLSGGSTIEHNFMLLIIFICFLFTINI